MNRIKVNRYIKYNKIKLDMIKFWIKEKKDLKILYLEECIDYYTLPDSYFIKYKCSKKVRNYHSLLNDDFYTKNWHRVGPIIPNGFVNVYFKNKDTNLYTLERGLLGIVENYECILMFNHSELEELWESIGKQRYITLESYKYKNFIISNNRSNFICINPEDLDNTLYRLENE